MSFLLLLRSLIFFLSAFAVSVSIDLEDPKGLNKKDSSVTIFRNIEIQGVYPLYKDLRGNSIQILNILYFGTARRYYFKYINSPLIK